MTITSNLSPGLFVRRWLLWAIAVLWSANLRGTAPDTEPKTHTLFVGADLAVMEQKELRPVEDVQGDAFVVKVDGKEFKVRTQWGDVAMKVEHSVKISAIPVAIGKLTFERAYTPEHDPAKIFAREQGEEEAVSQEWQALFNQVEAGGLLPSGGFSNYPTTGAGSENGQAAAHRLREMDGQMFSLHSHQTSLVGEMMHRISLELYDAVNVDFALTSPVPLRKPYVILMMRFHAVEAKADQSQNWLYAAELERLDDKPVRVRILKGGFPPGYILEGYQIHVYDGIHEVATNLADDHVALSQSEAYKYIRTEFLSSHQRATLEATAVMGVLSPAEQQGIGGEQFRRTFFVKVTKEGSPVAAFTDRELTQPVSDVVAGFVLRTRYLPALADGKPVDGVAELKFSRLSL
jgi:hypothetical protein